jgi:putative salt-induced outer membrane protein YdiY
MARKREGVGIVLGLIFLGHLIVAEGVFADKIVLENGDTLTGSVEKVMGGKLTLKTDYAGTVEMQVDKIKQIFTDHPVEVHLTTGEILKGKIRTGEDGKIVVEESPERQVAVDDWTKVTSVNPPPPRLWSGSINIGGSLQSGNTDRAGAHVSASTVWKTEQDRFMLNYEFNYAEEGREVTTRNHFGQLEYNYFFAKKFYGYMGIELQNDKFKDYTLRFAVGPGVGYQVWEDPVKFLLFEVGLAYVNINRYEGPHDEYLAARLASEFRYKIFSFLAFSEKVEFYTSLGEGGKYKARNEAALIVPVISGWALRFSNIVDYDSAPPTGVKRGDISWILSLQYSF